MEKADFPHRITWLGELTRKENQSPTRREPAIWP
jgi:hypothetical protein